MWSYRWGQKINEWILVDVTCNQCFSQTIALVSPQLYCLNKQLPSLQQCLQGAALEATRVTPSLCPARILWPGPSKSSLGSGEPHQPPPPLPLAQGALGGSEGSTAQLSTGRAFSSCPAAPDPREGQQPMDTRSQCSRAWSQPVWGTATGPQHWHTGLELTAAGKARSSTAQKWGSMEFIAQSTL